MCSSDLQTELEAANSTLFGSRSWKEPIGELLRRRALSLNEMLRDPFHIGPLTEISVNRKRYLRCLYSTGLCQWCVLIDVYPEIWRCEVQSQSNSVSGQPVANMGASLLERITEITQLLTTVSKQWERLELKINVNNRGEIEADISIVLNADKDEAMTTKELADYLKVDEKSIQALLKKGALKSFKVGRFVRIMRSDVKEFIRLSSCRSMDEA